jgi:hypothetical protein
MTRQLAILLGKQRHPELEQTAMRRDWRAGRTTVAANENVAEACSTTSSPGFWLR